MPICGAGPIEKAGLLKNIPFWFFHGAKDRVINPSNSVELLKAIQREGGRAKISLYPEANHNSWDPGFAEPDFLKWMFSQERVQKEEKNIVELSPDVEAIFQKMTTDEKIGQLN